MDGLLAEINSKRKALDDGGGETSTNGARKYMKRADVERAREEEESKKRAEVAKAKEAAKSQNRAAKMRTEVSRPYILKVLRAQFAGFQDGSARNPSLARMASPGSGRNTPDPVRNGSPAPVTTEAFNISSDEATRRLRAKGQPIRLFGESDKDRRLRLRALELLEERGGGAGLNDFRKTYADMESAMDEKAAGKAARESHQKAENAAKGVNDEQNGKTEEAEAKVKEKMVSTGPIDLSLVKTDPNKLYPLIYYALKVSWPVPGTVKKLTLRRMCSKNGKNGWRPDLMTSSAPGRAKWQQPLKCHPLSISNLYSVNSDHEYV